MSAAAEIAADLEGKQGFESHLAALTRKKEDLQKRIDSNKQWTVRGPHLLTVSYLDMLTTYSGSKGHVVAAMPATYPHLQEMFDKDVAPFQQKYVHLVDDIHNVYGTAKEVSLQQANSNDFSLFSRPSTCFQGHQDSQVSTCRLQFHAKGIQMLVDEFNYHVAYKRWDDTFNATPFKPK